MDQSILIQAGASATTITIFIVLAYVYKMVNHRRVRSNCCGKRLDVSLDIDSTTPIDVKTQNPLESTVNGVVGTTKA